MPATDSHGVLYNVTPSELTAYAANCRTTASDVADKLAHLRTYVVSLENDWRGIAADQFQTLMAEYDNAATTLHTVLTEIAGGLDGTALNYVQSDDAAKRNVMSVHIPGARLS
ncbi:WXG100 family type VII secretion target [Streptomyces sp. NPDC001380]|uniref:WXG100 family type VII secretion target n=1 Tax=Streptomyces sp. NPDC001380 TaxID=3364566 RepID=UPI00367DB052